MKFARAVRSVSMAVQATVCVVAATTAFAQVTAVEMTAVMSLGEEALGNYVQYALTEKTVIAFGFKSLAEAKAARVGFPYRVLTIDLNELKAYTAGSGLKAVATDPGILWFPVMVGSESRTKLELVRRTGQWIPGEFGDARSAQEVSNVRARLGEITQSKGIEDNSPVSLIQVPSLSVTLLYVNSGRGQYLVPAMVNPEHYGLTNGVLYPADELLLALKQFAASIKEGTIR